MRYCIFCGVKIPGDALYCQICGKKQPDDTITTEETTIQQKSGIAAWLSSPKNMLLAGIGGFLIVLFIATAIMIALLEN